MRIALLALLLAACPGKPADHPKAADDSALRIKIAQLEASRGDGQNELIELATRGEQPAKLLALRGLGRVGGAKALATLGTALLDGDPEIVGTAAAAIGVATSLDEDTAGQPAISKALLDAHAKHPADPRIVEAIGRAGEDSTQAELATLLRGTAPAPVQVAAADALGRFGRRKIALLGATRAALILATKHTDARVRHAAAYALAREHVVKPEESAEKDPTVGEAASALARLLRDPDPLVRAQAAQALARRKTVIEYGGQLFAAADDADWRVAVEAIRALAGEASNDARRLSAAVMTVRWVLGIDRKMPAFDRQRTMDDVVKELGERQGPKPRTISDEGAHVVIEGLRALAPYTTNDKIRGLVERTGKIASGLPGSLARMWIECLSTSASVRGANGDPGLVAARCELPDHLKLPLVGELIAAKVGTVEARRAALAPLLEHSDPRVRVSGMTALAAMWPDGGTPDHKATVAMTIAALGSKDGLVAGTAIETAETLYEHIDKDNATDLRDQLDAAVLARAQTEQDPELAMALFGTIGKRKLAGGAAACRAAVRGAPTLAKAAVDCLKNLGEAIELPPIGGAKPPPVDIVPVIGKRVIWKIATTRGEIVIELDPDSAPWAVATIVALTRKGFYDGLEFHRVVPNFVAQGGDPTQSGWGGPGFALPAEPFAGSGYSEGGVGMADAGRDSAGSQWFVMHGPAPHLDGRYTWIGRVASGQSAANSLLIGDKVQSATVELQNRP